MTTDKPYKPPFLTRTITKLINFYFPVPAVTQNMRLNVDSFKRIKLLQKFNP